MKNLQNYQVGELKHDEQQELNGGFNDRPFGRPDYYANVSKKAPESSWYVEFAVWLTEIAK